MRKFKEIKKEILALFDFHCSKNRLNIEAEITQEGSEFQIKIFEKISLHHHHFFSNPPLIVKSVPKDEFLTLNTEKIQILIERLFDKYEEHEEYPHPGSGINK